MIMNGFRLLLSVEVLISDRSIYICRNIEALFLRGKGYIRHLEKKKTYDIIMDNSALNLDYLERV